MSSQLASRLACCVLAAAIAVSACVHHQDTPAMSTTSCAAVVRQLISKELGSWHGLPSGCTLADLRTAGLEIGETEPVRTLGEAQVQASYRNARTAAFSENPQVWLRDGAVVRISVEHPGLPELPALLGALGAPEAKLDAWAATVPKRIPESEWVWPSRGIALVISGGEPPAEQLIVFAPTTLAQYRAQLRYDVAPREFPAE
jgi:hypothetical protein